MRRVAMCWVLAAACGRYETVSYTDIQGVCVDDGDLVVTFVGCLSSSCSTVASSTCAAELSGGNIEVSGSAQVKEDRLGPCTDDCGAITARCPVPDGAPDDAIILVGDDDGGPELGSAACD